MQHRTAAVTAKSNASAWTIVAAVILLLLIIGGLAYKDFSTHGPVPVKTATSDWLEKLARKSRGDIHKLSPEEQAQLNRIPMGGGAKWLKLKYESLH